VPAITKELYKAEATVTGGRDGHGTTSDGLLDLDLKVPVAMGGPGGGTNPEQLFAIGYAACFQSAMGVVSRRRKLDTSASTITAAVTIGTISGGSFGLAVALKVALPGIEPGTAREILEEADVVCPYSNATRGNIEVTLSLV
jgi:Ohr subfamily peroxiredoxin